MVFINPFEGSKKVVERIIYSIESIEFKYERLTFFCFLCGMMGHGEKDYHLAVDKGSKKQLEWGYG